MTEQAAFEYKCYRAIDVIKQIKIEETHERYVDKHKAFDMAISALEEIQQYRALGTVEEIEFYIRLAKNMNVCDLVRENARLSNELMFKELELRKAREK